MTDPIYGDNPIDPVALWNDTFRPTLVLINSHSGSRTVVSQMFDELLESQWLTRWRTSLVTSEGAQLEIWGNQLGYIKPVGWTDDRYKAVLVALFHASFALDTPDVVFDLANALLDVGQTFTFDEFPPCTGRFTFYNTDPGEAVAYTSALNRARSNGHQYYVVAHDGLTTPFVFGTSLFGGPDTFGSGTTTWLLGS